MSAPQPKPTPSVRREPDKRGPDEGVLRLADSNADDSTQPVNTSGSSRIGASPGGSARSGEPRLKAPGASDAGAEGQSSGGFETMLGSVVVQSGLVTAEELEQCNEAVQTSNASGEPRTLADMLVEAEFLTPRQLRRLRNEFEAKKTSQKIPGYRIKSKLGSGAMATVFLADQLSLKREVAIKVLPKKFSANEKFIERFYKEGRAAAQLNHPNIVAAYDVGKAGEHHYFVMEYVDGPTLYDLLVRDKRVDEKRAIDIIRQVALALQHAHERGFIHRDIKPKNIMINSQGVVKLADLGLARAVTDLEAAEAEKGRAYGTPYYISPEQIRGELKIGPQADIYGLGATFYHMVTGRVPFEGKNPSAVMHQHLKAQLEPPDHLNPRLSSGCAQVIEKMMAKDASERYQNANDLLEDLDLIAKGEPPHFAAHALDLATIAPTIQEPQAAPAVKVEERGPSLFESPMFLFVLALLALSLIVNVIMIAVALNG